MPRRPPAGAAPAVRVAVVPVASPTLLTIDASSPVWGVPDPTALVAGHAPRGCYVRIRPPPDAEPTEVQRVADAASAAGALRVRSDAPRRSAGVLPAPAPGARSPTHREAVAAVLARTRSADPAALAALCSEIMDEVSL